VQFPDVLRWLDENPAWTDGMGQAVTYQQGDVLDAIQDYRRLAKDVGNLKSNRYQTVRADPGQDIRIEPARPDVVYVPSYDPALATQPQPPPDTPGINPWIVFGGGAVVGALGAWALYSVFDSDHDHVTNNYYGGGRRRIRCYDNYYYYGKRRPREVDWTPRPRPLHQPQRGWQQPRRLRQAAPAAGRPAALRPPMARPGGASPRPGEVRREQRQENRQERQTQRQEMRQERRGQRQQQQEQHQEMRQERRGQQQEHRQQQQEQRQEQRQQQREQRQERQQGQREQQEQRQENRQQRQEQRQERRQERQQNGGGQQTPNKKKKRNE
jgi:hypothetical protein